jgi:drug/metabolite transporter (DMT)-like permease
LAITGSAGFSGSVTLACSGAPQYSACTLSPASLQVTPGSNQQFTVTVTTQTTTPASHSSVVRHLMPLGMFLLCFAFPRRFRKSLFHVGACAFVLIALGCLSGCGGSSGTTSAPTTNYTPAGTYHLTVTATSGTTNSTQSLTLVVQ